MRVALVITELEIGGAERCLTQLAIGMLSRKMEPTVYCLAPRPPEGRDQLVRVLESAGIAIHFLGARRYHHFPAVVFQLARLLKKQTPSFLQSFLFHGNVTGIIAATLARVPLIYTGLRVAEPERWRWWVLRLLSWRVQRMVCVSQSVADYATGQGNLSKNKLVVIPNGVDIASIDRTPPTEFEALGLQQVRRGIACVARFHAQKGIDWLLELTPEFLDRLQEHHLLLVGSGELLEEAQRYVQTNNLEKRVHFLNQRNDVIEIIKACDLLVLPSRWEGLPNVLLEAMACKLPVVATRVQGVSEVLGPLTDEQSVEIENRVDFIEKVVELCNDQEKANQLGQQNRLRVEQHFSLNQLHASYSELYPTDDPYHSNLQQKKNKK